MKGLILPKSKRHNVFISYYHEDDQRYKNRFVRLMGDNIIDKSVNIGEIDDNSPPTEATLQRIREDYIALASVTVVLIGRCTWQRKYVDWEIGASLRETRTNPRCGMIGILLPSHPDFRKESYRENLIPPRLADNCDGDRPFASIYDWTTNADTVRDWIHAAFLRRRKEPPPDISRHPFGGNWNGDCLRGWQA